MQKLIFVYKLHYKHTACYRDAFSVIGLDKQRVTWHCGCGAVFLLFFFEIEL